MIIVNCENNNEIFHLSHYNIKNITDTNKKVSYNLNYGHRLYLSSSSYIETEIKNKFVYKYEIILHIGGINMYIDDKGNIYDYSNGVYIIINDTPKVNVHLSKQSQDIDLDVYERYIRFTKGETQYIDAFHKIIVDHLLCI